MRPLARSRLAALGAAALFPLLASLLAFAIGAVVILVSGQDPVAAYAALARGSLGSPTAIGRTLLNATPLIFTGLAVAVPFRAGLFNIGGEGQLYAGAITAAWLGIALPLPAPLVVLVAIVAGGLAGFAWGAIPGALKFRGAHEVITTIMLNFIAINLTVWLALNPLSGGGTVPGTATIDPARRIAQLGLGLGRAHWGIVLGLLAAAAAYLVVWRTARGYELRAVGLAPGTARFAGIPIGANGFLALAMGGMFAGLGGAIEVLAVYGKMTVPFVSNLGFNGIGVALLGRNHPVGVILGALFFGAVAAGAQEMQFAADVPLEVANILLAIVLLFVTATRLVEFVFGRRARDVTAAIRIERGLGA